IYGVHLPGGIHLIAMEKSVTFILSEGVQKVQKFSTIQFPRPLAGEGKGEGYIIFCLHLCGAHPKGEPHKYVSFFYFLDSPGTGFLRFPELDRQPRPIAGFVKPVFQPTCEWSLFIQKWTIFNKSMERPDAHSHA
ncbi:hypothetical protein JXO59_02170, partial [candidate division KSB1 bacterium]|nr:hypothetical protein [candidate division KSB1 bacterium]